MIAQGWYADAEAVLLNMLADARRPSSGVAALARTAELSLARLHAMLANCYLRAGQVSVSARARVCVLTCVLRAQLAKALAAIDVALAVSSAQDLGALARYLYVRGKVPHALPVCVR
jgi:hypothetical protein